MKNNEAKRSIFFITLLNKNLSDFSFAMQKIELKEFLGG